MGDILADFLVKRPEGYYCKYGDFFVDPLRPVSRAVVTHAHADHASPGHGQIYCTSPTAGFMRYRYGSQPRGSFIEWPYQQPLTIGGVVIRFIPAGHILGSAQLLMEFDGVRYLFTGDYKMQTDDTCEALEVVQADVMITESTFADPFVSHPDPIAEINKINGKPHHILLGAYALGKAQRLTALINKHCTGRKVMVHAGILPIHRLYGEMGIKHLNYQPYDRREMKTNAAHHIYLVPPMAFNSYYKGNNVIRVFASGWKRLQQNNDMDLYISDHVDWSDILAYVEQVKPSEIWTVHGDGRHLADHFAGSIPVKAIG